MKKETKGLIDWIKKQISLAGTIVTDISKPRWQQDRDKAITFLNSLPEIESHLCRGGYIQDRNGTPCCDGDEILINGEFEAVLKWIVYTENNPDKMPHFGFQWKCDINNVDELPSFWIKKVEK